MKKPSARICLSLALAAAICCGCKTYIPKQVHAAAPSLGSDGVQDSGFKGFFVRDSITNGVLTTESKEKLDALVAAYGGYWRPPLKRAQLQPFTNGTWLIDGARLVKFQSMRRWERSGLPPKKDWTAVITSVALVSLAFFALAALCLWMIRKRNS